MKDKVAALCMAASETDAYSQSIPSCLLCGHSHQGPVPWLRLTCQATVLDNHTCNPGLIFCGCRGVRSDM
jgi:hypothetical protein